MFRPMRSLPSYDSFVSDETSSLLMIPSDNNPSSQQNDDNTAADADEQEVSSTTVPPSSSSHSRRPRRSNKTMRSFLLLVLVMCVALVLAAITPYIPTADELELAKDYPHLPLLSTARRIRLSQQQADSSRQAFLSDATVKFDKVLKTVSKQKNAAKHYMEPPEGCEATVVIVRHCEKGHIREHCAYVGMERSVYLASLFGDEKEARWPAPSFIFAEGPGQRKNHHKMNFREIETVGPLSEKVGVKVDDSYSTKTVNKLAKEILTFLQTGQMCGKVTVIAWKHSNIGHLAQHIGCGPMQGCPLDYHGKSFDEAWQIKFVYRQFEHSERKNLKLPNQPQWKVFGNVQQEGFDPLAFSKKVGDYSASGTAHAGRWKKSQVDYPERKKQSDTAGWQQTRVGFTSAPDDGT